MSGRRYQGKAERRAAILEIARRSFLVRGYGGTTMSGVSEDLGGSKGTLWSYFKSKDELFAAVVETATVEFRAEITQVLGREANLREGLTGFCETFILRVTSADAIALQRLIIGEIDRFSEIGRIFYDRGPGKNREILSDYLAGRMAEGRLRSDDAGRAAEMLLALCTGGYHQRVIWGVERPTGGLARKEAANAVSHFLSCYAEG